MVSFYHKYAVKIAKIEFTKIVFFFGVFFLYKYGYPITVNFYSNTILLKLYFIFKFRLYLYKLSNH